MAGPRQGEFALMDKSLTSLLKTQAYIDGMWTGEPGLPVYDKASGDLIARVPDLGAAETRAAVEAAHRAFRPWASLLAKERSRILKRWHQLILDHTDELALIITREQGKPLSEAVREIMHGASYIEFYAEEAKRVYGEIIPTTRQSARALVAKQAVGVVAAITPWNFPSSIVARKIAPALAAGCTVVVKPAEATPLSALALAALADQAGFPKGVLNVVTCENPEEVGLELTTNPLVRMVTFTGSTPVGKLLMRQAAGTVKKVALELGGNAPLIVFDDADLDAAVRETMTSKFRNTGQTCVCANRILVQAGVYDAFAERLAEDVAKLNVGAGIERGVTQGPLISTAAVEKVEAHIADAVGKGARIATGGKRHSLGGSFFEPTILTGATSDMIVAREETFGPVAALFRFDTEADAIHMANDTQYGLAAYIFTRDVGRVWRVAEALEYGIVGINEGTTSNELAPFGGIKESGLGREGSRHGIEEFLEMKYMLMGGI
jgi:succinate-semialdehyde dehydrogenase/glutarate-semialdehyde dehydrogenase